MASSTSLFSFDSTLPIFSRRSVSPSDDNSVLECRVCNDAFGLQGEKVPRILHCGHTVCHQCLSRLPQLDGNVQCPFDRQPTSLPQSGVWGLKKNFALLELLERFQYGSMEKRRTDENLEKLYEKERELNIPCDENEGHIAVFYCTVCCTHLCFDCSENTHNTRTLMRHRRIPITEKPRENAKCELHPNHYAEFACLESDCNDMPLMCFLCRDYGRHFGHRHALVENEAASIRQQVIGAVKSMREFAEDVSQMASKMSMVIQQMEGGVQHVQGPHGSLYPHHIPGTVEQARMKVRQHFAELRDHLNQQELAALTVVDAHAREKLCSLKQQQEDIASLLSQVATMVSQCDVALRKDDSRIILAKQDLQCIFDSVHRQQQQFLDLPDQTALDGSIPITYTKDNRVHIGSSIWIRVVTLGLDNSGKTSLLFRLKQNEFIATIPTIGFNVETVEYKNLKFTIWDVGGQPKLRPLWKHYYLNTQAVIYVIDSNDRDRLIESSNELVKLVSERELQDASLLILANKQDVENHMGIEELTRELNLVQLCCGRTWHLQACDAISGHGLVDGLEWLSRQLVATVGRAQ